MAWEIKFHPLAKEELAKLDGSIRKIVLKGIIKVSANPKPQSEGGYGKPLGNKGGNDLTGLLKIKYRDIGIRVVYKLLENEKTHEMYILVISARADNEVYDLAGKKKITHNMHFKSEVGSSPLRYNQLLCGHPHWGAWRKKMENGIEERF